MGTRLLLHYSNQQISAVCTLAWTFSHRLRTPQSPDRFYPRLRTLINLPIDSPCSRFVPSQIQFLNQSNFASPLSPALPFYRSNTVKSVLLFDLHCFLSCGGCRMQTFITLCFCFYCCLANKNKLCYIFNNHFQALR